MSKFLTLILFSILLAHINCTCTFGYFTTTSPCDTQANPIPYQKYTSTIIGPGQWTYYYVPLMGLESNIKLNFKVDGALPDAYLTFQPAMVDNLPTDTSYYYSFHVQEGGLEMPPQKKINGIDDFDEAIMILGLKNSDSSAINVQVEYSAQRGDNNDDGVSPKKLILGVAVSFSVVVVILLCLSGYAKLMLRRLAQRHAAEIQNGNATDIEAQGILQNNRANDHLSLEELQKYFPKKPFKDLENPFQQTGCSVCLDDFVPDASCHQLYCNHIFHEACVEKWLEKHHNCPGCRVPIGKKAIEEFLQKQNEMKKDDNALEIKIQGVEIANQKESNNQGSS